MHISQFKESKFLRKEDCAKGILVTIERIEQQNVAQEGELAEMKHCLIFREDVHPMVLNITNARLIASIIGSEETDDWHGHAIVLYNDPTIVYAGKVVGGIRVRAAKQPIPGTKPKPAPAPAPAPIPEATDLANEEDDEVPF